MDGANFCCNILWFFLGGFELCIGWYFTGLILCCTIIGIPAGVQCFKIGSFALCPFGKEIVPNPNGTTACDTCLNIIWCFTFGLFMAIFEAFFGILCFMTIVGIPFGVQHFKLARLSFMPFGNIVVETGAVQPGQPIVVVQPVAQPMIIAQPVVAQPPQYVPPTTPMAGGQYY